MSNIRLTQRLIDALKPLLLQSPPKLRHMELIHLSTFFRRVPVIPYPSSSAIISLQRPTHSSQIKT